MLVYDGAILVENRAPQFGNPSLIENQNPKTCMISFKTGDLLAKIVKTQSNKKSKDLKKRFKRLQ